MDLSEDHRRRIIYALMGIFCLIALYAVFFLGNLMVQKNVSPHFLNPGGKQTNRYEVFGFAPYWTLSKLGNLDWRTLTTLAYFSVPVNYDGTLDKTSQGYQSLQSPQVASLFQKARENKVRRVVTLTQMDSASIETFLSDPQAQKRLTDESIRLLYEDNLDGVNIDFEYLGQNNLMKSEFSDFISSYTRDLKASLNNPYVTVSVVASAVHSNLIYDVGSLSKSTDGIFVMAYDFYYSGSDKIGPSAPLYGYDGGKGPFWYDVSTAVNDFLTEAPADKIILGVPYYGWNYPAPSAAPKVERSWGNAFATTNDSASQDQLLTTTPAGGWDNTAHVAWRGYYDNSGWHVVYVEDKKSLGEKYDFAKSKHLAGVGIWALGYDDNDPSLWNVLSQKFPQDKLISKI